MSRVAVVDDHVLLSEVLAQELELRGHDVSVVDVRDDVVTQLETVHPEIVILDLEFGADRLAGVRLIEPLTAGGRSVIILTGVTDELVIGECLELGATGVLRKSDDFDTLVDAVSACGDGRAVPPCDAERLRLIRSSTAARRKETHLLEPFDGLTEREQQVLRQLVHGRSAAEISAAEYVAISTVRTQIKSVLRKLDVSSQLRAVVLAIESGWVSRWDARVSDTESRS